MFATNAMHDLVGLIANCLKGPKHEIFESGFFTQIRRLWLGELGTGKKNGNFESWSHYFKVFAASFLLSV
jgi:hypothetical protein